jgi:hypothetical protein
LFKIEVNKDSFGVPLRSTFDVKNTVEGLSKPVQSSTPSSKARGFAHSKSSDKLTSKTKVRSAVKDVSSCHDTQSQMEICNIKEDHDASL